MTTPAYYRAWRAANPDYRARQNRLRNERRRRQGRDRAAEYARRPSRATPPLPEPFDGHPIFAAARAIVGPERSSLVTVRDPLHEDLLSVAVVALVEGSDPREAVRRFRTIEHGWRRVTAPLLEFAA